MSKKAHYSALQTAGIGLAFTLPFIFTNIVVATKLEPFYSLIGSFSVISGPFLPLLLLLLFPIGAYIIAHPMIRTTAGGRRTMYPVNAILATITIVVFLILFTALGEDVYRCDILHIPNCD